MSWRDTMLRNQAQLAQLEEKMGYSFRVQFPVDEKLMKRRKREREIREKQQMIDLLTPQLLEIPVKLLELQSKMLELETHRKNVAKELSDVVGESPFEFNGKSYCLDGKTYRLKERFTQPSKKTEETLEKIRAFIRSLDRDTASD